jgi:hypothetical protein
MFFVTALISTNQVPGFDFGYATTASLQIPSN